MGKLRKKENTLCANAVVLQSKKIKRVYDYVKYSLPECSKWMITSLHQENDAHNDTLIRMIEDGNFRCARVFFFQTASLTRVHILVYYYYFVLRLQQSRLASVHETSEVVVHFERERDGD